MAKYNMWMPLYIGDYHKDTQFLNRKEHGSYLLLIMAYWSQRAPLRDDDEELAVIAKCPPDEWPKTREKMLQFFKVKDGFWTHKRIDIELNQAQELYAKKVNQTEAARTAKAEKLVTKTVTEIVTENVTQGQSQPQSPILKEFPEALRTARVMNKWGVWMNVRRGKAKCKDWLRLFNEQIEWLSQYSEPEVFEILSTSIIGDYQGLFPPKNHANNKQNSSQRIDRSIGTANEGKAALYRGLGKLAKPETSQ